MSHDTCASVLLMTTTTEATETLTGLIRKVLDTSSLSDPREVAAKVVSMTPQSQVAEFYELSVVDAVRAMIGHQRTLAMANAINGQVEPATIKPKFRSAKLSQRRDWWAEMMLSLVHVGNSTWKVMSECTATDLLVAETERREQAEKLIVAAGLYQTLRTLLDQHDVATVGELPADARELVRS